MKVLSLLFIVLLASCGRTYEVKKAVAPKDGVKINAPLAASTSINDYAENPDTITFFWLPKLGSMDWDSTVFNVSDDDDTKLTDIMANVIKISDAVDQIDRDTKPVIERMEVLDELIFDADCDFLDPGDDGYDECEDWTDEYDLLSITAADLIKRKEDKIREIEMTVDNVDYVDDGSGSLTRKGEYTNWFTYCAPSDSAKVNTFNMASAVPVIKMPHMGTKHINEYSTDDGSVYNVRYVPSEYAPNTMMLHFEVKEKGGDGSYTGHTWKAELERIFFIGKMRFSGDVYRYDAKGNLVQRGILKFELPAL